MASVSELAPPTGSPTSTTRTRPESAAASRGFRFHQESWPGNPTPSSLPGGLALFHGCPAGCDLRSSRHDWALPSANRRPGSRSHRHRRAAGMGCRGQDSRPRRDCGGVGGDLLPAGVDAVPLRGGTDSPGCSSRHARRCGTHGFRARSVGGRACRPCFRCAGSAGLRGGATAGCCRGLVPSFGSGGE